MKRPQSPAEREREAMIASPSDPRTEYVPASAGVRVLCGCPRTVLDDGPRSWQLKLWHDSHCSRPRRPRAARLAEVTGGGDPFGLGAYLSRLPRAIPCPRCGNVAHTLTASGGRQCAGAAGCGHEWVPGRRAAA